ncbi:MAG: DegV family protein [Clostridia bacterium]|nr:DegV family protein [Clostridia bacterium]
MSDYVIYTDSACDLSPSTLKQWGIGYSSMTFMFDDFHIECSGSEANIPAFYRKMREGSVAKTAAINSATFLVEFEDILQQGKDVLYIGFSSVLSSTYHAARVAANELKAQYPKRKILTVDSLSGSAGQALLIYLVLEEKKKGATLEQAATFAEQMRHKICHWITVEDLIYLKRGGRISSKTAFVGNMLGLKPLLYVNDEGKLVSGGKIRGRKKALEALVDRYGEMTARRSDGIVFISHADCKNEAMQVAERLRERYNASVRLITDIGPVIGAHGGPGTIAIFFVGKSR